MSEVFCMPFWSSVYLRTFSIQDCGRKYFNILFEPVKKLLCFDKLSEIYDFSQSLILMDMTNINTGA